MGNKEAPAKQTAPEPNQQNPITQTPTRQQDMQNPNVSQSQINPLPVKSFNDNLSCLNKLTKTQKILLFSILFLLISITGVIISLYLSIKQPIMPVDVQRGQIYWNNKIIQETVKPVELNLDGKKRDAIVYGLGKEQVQVAHPNTQSILKAIKDGSTIFYEFLIPVFSIFEKFGIERKQKNPLINWLEIINQNVREKVDKLSDLVSEIFSKKTSTKNGTEVPNKFNLTYVNLTEIVWALVKYDPLEENFKLVTLTDSDSSEGASAKVQGNSDVSNLKAENKKEQKKNEKAQTPKSDLKETPKKQASKDKVQDQPKPQKKQEAPPQPTKQQTSSLLNQVMVQTVGYIKRKAEQSIHVYKEQSEQVKRIHMQLTDKDEIEDQQQKALLECGVVQNLLFRCPFKSVVKLVPGMTEEKLMAPGGNFVLVYGLKIVLKETKQMTQ